ncbi:MAG: adenosylcobinamide-GDP ribazoletransferase [Chloroflexi bacterium]|nr:adenosylcobinamide-GDP ribazoletransferase [Chloroflexota bacterium]
MWADVRGAFTFLTILPFGFPTGRQPGWIFTWFPLVGLLIGLLIAGVARFAPFSPDLTAFVALAAWVIITGGLHLDGLGDSADGLLAAVPAARRLEIMKDPRAGSWAVITLTLVLLGKYLALRALDARLLILPPVVGRWVLVLAAVGFPYARRTQASLGGHYRTGLGRAQRIGATLITLPVVISASGDWRVAALVIVIGLATVGLGGMWAARQLGGGLTGDVYGALCEMTELLCLIGLNLVANWG